MSALAQSQSLIAPFRTLSELDALQEMSRQASGATNLHSGANALIECALRVKGIARLALEPGSNQSTSSLQLGWGTYLSGTARGPKSSGSAVAPITSQARTWGNVRVVFYFRTNTLQSPLRFARFIGQQLGGLLNRIDLLERREVIASGNDALRRRLATRKVAQRAAGLVAESRSISSREALLLLIRRAHESRDSVAHIAEAIVLSHADVWSVPGKLRRLHSAEFTSTLPRPTER